MSVVIQNGGALSTRLRQMTKEREIQSFETTMMNACVCFYEEMSELVVLLNSVSNLICGKRKVVCHVCAVSWLKGLDNQRQFREHMLMLTD